MIAANFMRAVLFGAGLLLALTGCTSGSPTPPLTPLPTPTPINDPLPNSNGAMFGANTHHTGVYLSYGPRTKPSLKWQFVSEYYLPEGTPAVVGDTVYYAAQFRDFYAFDAQTGQVKWSLNSTEGLNSSPAVADNVLYFADNDHLIHAVDASNGRKIWQSYIEEYPLGDPAVVGDFVFVQANPYTHALDRKTGKEIWRKEIYLSTNGPPTVADGIVYISTEAHKGPGYVYALDAVTGQERWRFATPEGLSPASHTVVADGMLFFSGEDDYLYAVDAQKGTLIWKRLLNMFSDPTIANGRLYVADLYNVYALDQYSGKEIWRRHLGDGLISCGSLAAGVLYFGYSDTRLTLSGFKDEGHLYALDAQSGAELWRYKVDGLITAAPAVKDGSIYFMTTAKLLYALR